MTKRYSTLATLAVLALASVGAFAAEAPFDIDVLLGITPEMTSELTAEDTIRVILRPEMQYGLRTAPGEPIVLERKFDAEALAQPIHFPKALRPDEIYRLEVQIVRPGAKQPVTVSYVSALDKLPRTPVEQGIKLRLFQGAGDARNNLVMLVKDSDGVYRVQIFFA
jgi:hypothetical protein